MDSLVEQAEHYFSLMDKGENILETDKLLIAMVGETLQNNNIGCYADYLKLNDLRKSVHNQAFILKEQFNHAKHYYDVYNDIVQTYRTISEGEYISRLIQEKKQEKERQKRTTAKKAADRKAMSTNETTNTVINTTTDYEVEIGNVVSASSDRNFIE